MKCDLKQNVTIIFEMLSANVAQWLIYAEVNEDYERPKFIRKICQMCSTEKYQA